MQIALKAFWYPVQASRISEYVAMALQDDLLKMASFERTALTAG